MNHQLFDILTRDMVGLGSRRDVLRGLVSLGLGVGVARLPAIAEAKKKRKHKPKKPKSNAYGCLEVDDPCKNADQCCSGVCEGKKGKRTCRAHDTGVCRQDDPGICREGNPALALCAIDCLCFRTTAGSNVCAEGLGPLLSQCVDCQKDADCLALGLPSGTACAPVSEGNCTGACAGGMACVLPCGTELPEQTE